MFSWSSGVLKFHSEFFTWSPVVLTSRPESLELFLEYLRNTEALFGVLELLLGTLKFLARVPEFWSLPGFLGFNISQ